MLALSLSSKFDLTVKFCLLLKLPTRNWSLDYIMKFFLLRLLCVSINLSDSLAWNTVAMSGLVVLAATGMLDKLQKQICRTVGLSLAASLELLLIIEM